MALLRVCDGAGRVGTGTCLGPAFVFPREVCGGRVRKKRLRLWEGAGGGRVSAAVRIRAAGARSCVCVCVWRCLAWLRGLARWLSDVSGSAAVHGWPCHGAVVPCLSLQPREEGPRGEDAAPLHRSAGSG